MLEVLRARSPTKTQDLGEPSQCQPAYADNMTAFVARRKMGYQEPTENLMLPAGERASNYRTAAAVVTPGRSVSLEQLHGIGRARYDRRKAN